MFYKLQTSFAVKILPNFWLKMHFEIEFWNFVCSLCYDKLSSKLHLKMQIILKLNLQFYTYVRFV
jgi:hypothetical protein